jgi:hypothetical protein
LGVFCASEKVVSRPKKIFLAGRLGPAQQMEDIISLLRLLVLFLAHSCQSYMSHLCPQDIASSSSSILLSTKNGMALFGFNPSIREDFTIAIM